MPRFSRASVLFVSWFAVLASCESRFSSIFFLSMGLTSSQAGAMNECATNFVVQCVVSLVIGIVLAVRPFVALIATPLWSAPYLRFPFACGDSVLKVLLRTRVANETF
jgi:hypothetical protein